MREIIGVIVLLPLSFVPKHWRTAIKRSGFVCWFFGHIPAVTQFATEEPEGFRADCKCCGGHYQWRYGETYADDVFVGVAKRGVS